MSGDSPGFWFHYGVDEMESTGPPFATRFSNVFQSRTPLSPGCQGLGAADVQSTADSKVVCEAKEEEEAPLPLGWKQVWCEEYQERVGVGRL